MTLSRRKRKQLAEQAGQLASEMRASLQSLLDDKAKELDAVKNIADPAQRCFSLIEAENKLLIFSKEIDEKINQQIKSLPDVIGGTTKTEGTAAIVIGGGGILGCIPIGLAIGMIPFDGGTAFLVGLGSILGIGGGGFKAGCYIEDTTYQIDTAYNAKLDRADLQETLTTLTVAAGKEIPGTFRQFVNDLPGQAISIAGISDAGDRYAAWLDFEEKIVSLQEILERRQDGTPGNLPDVSVFLHASKKERSVILRDQYDALSASPRFVELIKKSSDVKEAFSDAALRREIEGHSSVRIHKPAPKKLPKESL